MDWDRIQAEQQVWAERNFGKQVNEVGMLGMLEECGELSHAVLKHRQGIRGTAEQHDEEARDAIGDVMIYMLDFCNARELRIAAVVERGRFMASKRTCPKDTVFNAIVHLASALGGVADCLHEEGVPHEHRTLCESCGDPQEDLSLMVAALEDFCRVKGWDFDEIVEKAWAHVMRRDWEKNRKDGSAESAAQG